MSDRLTHDGAEIPDQEPIVIHFRGRVINQFDQVREFIRRELHQHRTGEIETIEEANDFDVDDDLFPVSPHEYDEETERSDHEVAALSRQKASSKAPAAPAASGVAVQAAPATPTTSEPEA